MSVICNHIFCSNYAVTKMQTVTEYSNNNCMIVKFNLLTVNFYYITLCLKMLLLCHAIALDIHESILIIFGKDATEKVGSQRVLHFPPCLTSASALRGKMQKHKNSILLLEHCTVALPD